MGILLSLYKRQLIQTGDYFVIGVDVEQYDADQEYKFFNGIFKNSESDLHSSGPASSSPHQESIVEKSFQSYLGIMSSPPTDDFEDFSLQVNKYMQLPPFAFENPVNELGGRKRVR